MEKIEIKQYLKDYDPVKKFGTCITCLKPVQWCRARLAAHKRAGCTAVTAEEKLLFTKKKISEVADSSLDDSRSSIGEEAHTKTCFWADSSLTVVDRMFSAM